MEKRAYVRLPLNIELEYRVQSEAAAPPPTAQGKNLSTGGICMVLDRRLAPGTLLRLSMHVPDSYATLVLAGRVTWVSEVSIGGEPTFETGVAFTEVPAAATLILDRFLTARISNGTAATED